MSLNSANSHLRRATGIVSKIMRDFDTSVFELHRHLDAVREELEETGKSLITGARPKDGDVEMRRAANDKSQGEAQLRLKAGLRMPDGTVYAGLSPDTGKPMYATPKDAPLTMKWIQAMEYAAALDAHGHHDWRVPTKDELNVLVQNRAAIGGSMNPVRTQSVGTGRPHRTATTMRGITLQRRDPVQLLPEQLLVSTVCPVELVKISLVAPHAKACFSKGSVPQAGRGHRLASVGAALFVDQLLFAPAMP